MTRTYMISQMLLLAACIAKAAGGNGPSPQTQYEQLEHNLARGRNTWDTRSVLTHVYLPYGFVVEMSMVDKQGRRREPQRQVLPLGRALGIHITDRKQFHQH